MTKNDLFTFVANCKAETKQALEIVLAELNQGQRKKIIANPVVKELLDRYEVIIKK